MSADPLHTRNAHESRRAGKALGDLFQELT
jgi:hypothetical protein